MSFFTSTRRNPEDQFQYETATRDWPSFGNVQHSKDFAPFVVVETLCERAKELFAIGDIVAIAYNKLGKSDYILNLEDGNCVPTNGMLMNIGVIPPPDIYVQMDFQDQSVFKISDLAQGKFYVCSFEKKEDSFVGFLHPDQEGVVNLGNGFVHYGDDNFRAALISELRVL